MELSGLIYTCSAGETYDSIALALYGDEKHASALLGANPELCRKMVFDGGETLRIPVVEVPETGRDAEFAPIKAPWRS